MIENEKEQDFLGKISQQPDSQVEDEDKGSSKPLTKNQLQRIKEGALENCSLKEWQLQQCMKQGSLTERLTMCWQLRQGFWDCVEQQKVHWYLNHQAKQRCVGAAKEGWIWQDREHRETELGNTKRSRFTRTPLIGRHGVVILDGGQYSREEF